MIPRVHPFKTKDDLKQSAIDTLRAEVGQLREGMEHLLTHASALRNRVERLEALARIRPHSWWQRWFT